MKIEINRITEQTLEEFGTKYGLTMEVVERNQFLNTQYRYFASFKDVEVDDGNGFLGSPFGNGKTPKQAIKNYIPQISMKRIVINAMKPSRQEICVPRIKKYR